MEEILSTHRGKPYNPINKGEKMKKNLLLSLLLVSAFILGGGFIKQAFCEDAATAFTSDAAVDAAPMAVDFAGDDKAVDKLGRKGKVQVISNSSYCATNISMNGVVQWDDELPPGYTLTIKKVPPGDYEMYAEECTGAGHWGPTDLTVSKGKTSTWTLNN